MPTDPKPSEGEPLPQGGEMIPIPSVIGFTPAAAKTKLTAAGFITGATLKEENGDIRRGAIISTRPPATTMAQRGESVDLVVAGGGGFWESNLTLILFGIMGALVLVGFAVGMAEPSGSFLRRLADKDLARGLITFLIAVATVAIAIIVGISTIVLEEGPESDKRFDRGKQVLSVLIGVLGTIVGFYFGSETQGKAGLEPVKITTAALPQGTVGTAYQGKIDVSGGKPPFHYFVTPKLPAGLALDEKGAIAGTPDSVAPKATYNFRVNDSAIPEGSASADLSLEIVPKANGGGASPPGAGRGATP